MFKDLTWDSLVEFVQSKSTKEYNYHCKEYDSIINDENDFLNLKSKLDKIEGKQFIKFMMIEK